MSQKRILILYTSIGWGHKSIAENLAFHFRADGWEVGTFDVLATNSGALVKLSEKLHGIINRHFPYIWEWLYQSKLVTSLMLRLRSSLARKNSNLVEAKVKEFKPAIILTTQTTASAAAAYLKQSGKFHGKLVVAFSDYHLHRLWLYDEADSYLVVTEEQKSEMVKLGVPPKKIHICGITLKPKLEVDAAAVRNELNLRDEKIVLVLSGSIGIGFPERELREFIEKMENDSPGIRLVIVCGKNRSLRQKLVELQASNVTILGLRDGLEELYAVSDCVVTKPGGMSLAEMWSRDIVPIISHWLPGQETLNIHYLKKHQLAILAQQPLRGKKLAMDVKRFLDNERPKLPELAKTIVQSGREGKTVISAINSLFHGV